MRRAPIVVAATAAGLALVLTFRSQTNGPGSAAKRHSLTSFPGSRSANGSGYTPNGPVEVKVTVAQGHVVAVTNLELPHDNAHSLQLSQFSGPVLRKEALRAQSPFVDAVSGATMTSTAYQKSLQQALDKLGFNG